MCIECNAETEEIHFFATFAGNIWTPSGQNVKYRGNSTAFCGKNLSSSRLHAQTDAGLCVRTQKNRC